MELSAQTVKSRPFRLCPSLVGSVTASSFGRACFVCWPSVEWRGSYWDGGASEEQCAKTRLEKAGTMAKERKHGCYVHGWTGGNRVGGWVVGWWSGRGKGCMERHVFCGEKVLFRLTQHGCST